MINPFLFIFKFLKYIRCKYTRISVFDWQLGFFKFKAEQTFAGTKLLLDATRARNLGIILTGLKAEGARHIREVINSVTEDEFFPAEKLTTIRRYQPTSDDIELFKLYSDKKSTLDPVDRFMCELCEIEYIGTRLDLILLLWDFPRQLRCTHEVRVM